MELVEHHVLRDRQARRALVVALLVQLAVLAWIVLTPSASMPTSVVERVSAELSSWGVPSLLADTEVVEFLLNVGMFVPIGATLALLLPRVPWWGWAVVGLVTSSGIEAAQLLFLDARSATMRDVLANTLGLALGGMLGTAVALLATHARRLRRH